MYFENRMYFGINLNTLNPKKKHNIINYGLENVFIIESMLNYIIE